MRITRVSVEGVGRFGTPVSIDGLGPGVNILAASNEAGKSTLFKAIRACLFERHGTRNAEVAALATEGLSLPVSVTLGFEHGGKSYELAKSFIRGPSASLREGGREIARGRDADERAWEILGIDPGSGRSVDEAAFGMLWVSQGQSFHAPAPQGAAAIALNEAISQEVGTLVGGERARQVMAAIAADLSRQIKENGKPRKDGPLDRAVRQAESLADELKGADERLRELDHMLDQLAALRAQLRTAADPADAQRLAAELDAARRELKSAEDAAERLARAATAERQSQQLLDAEQSRHQALVDRAETIDRNRARAAELDGELAPLKAREEEIRQAINDAYDRRRSAEDGEKALALDERAAQRLAAVVHRAATRDELAARLEALTDYLRRQAAVDADLQSNGVDAAALKACEEIEQLLLRIDARLEAAAAHVLVDNPKGEAVTVNGELLRGRTSMAATEPLAIRLGDGVSVTITPPAAGDAARSEREAQRQRLADLLATHQAATPDDLRRRRAARQESEQALQALGRELKAFRLAGAPAAEIARLAAERDGIDRETAACLADHGLAALPPASEISAALDGLRERRDALQPERERLDALIRNQNQSLQQLVGRKGELQAAISEIAGQIAADTGALPDGERQARLAASKSALEEKKADHRTKAAALEELRENTPSTEDIDRQRNRLARFEEAAKNRAERTETLKTAIAKLEGQVEGLGGEGLGELAETLRDQLAIAGAERARQEARVETLKLLQAVVQEAYDKRREQLNAPLKRHLRPFLHDLFHGADLDLDDGFRIAGLRRNGPLSEAFERLSDGTREQIAVLVRLAMGAMIADKGNEVPIILDDALVFSDDARIEQMFDALNRAGQRQQVIVFTCRARSFTSLGGRQLAIV